MMNNENYRTYIFIFLVFCVMSSKHIIIYNEETLVALSFFSFIFFVYHYYANVFAESLDERSTTISTELQNFLHDKQLYISESIGEYKKILQIQPILHSVQMFTLSQLSTANAYTQKAFSSVVTLQIRQKLKTLSSSKSTLQQKLQQYISETIFPSVLLKIQSVKKTLKHGKKNMSVNRRYIKNAIRMYKTIQS